MTRADRYSLAAADAPRVQREENFGCVLGGGRDKGCAYRRSLRLRDMAHRLETEHIRNSNLVHT
jgi:hypothetical protein